MPDRETLERLEGLFFEAIALPENERSRFLADKCAGDAALRRSLDRLLNTDQKKGGLIDTAPWTAEHLGTHLASLPYDDPLARPGAQVGSYTILEAIGSGGMGTVWLARRTADDFHQRVALKLIKRGLDTDDILKRFRGERKILGQLEHPNIARLLDGGATTDGRPYLVMEFVDGEPIDRWCDRRQLAIRERLQLFRTVCSAVQYAHANLIVHRDLKPGNILINGEGQPKLLDFGLAKILRVDSDHEMSVTQENRRILTPRYASPEQIRGGMLTTASDVYSLGVILYELLTGRSPYEPSAGGRVELEKAVLEQDITRPSAAIQLAGGLRSTSLRRLQATLRGDMDNIVLTALQRNPARRYVSAEMLAADIDLHLRGLPVSAAPDSFAYRASRFVRRNRSLVAIVATATMALFATTAIAIWFAAQESRARAEAVHRAQELQQVVSFQERQLSGINAEVLGADLRHAILDKRRSTLSRGTTDESEVQRAIQQLEASLIGVNFTDIGREVFEKNVFQGALAVLTAEFAAQPLVKAALLESLAISMNKLGLHDRAAEAQTEAVAIRKEKLGLAHAEVLTSIDQLGEIYSALGKYTEAEAFTREALEQRRRILGDEHPDTLSSLHNIGTMLEHLGKLPDAESAIRQAVDGFRRSLGNEHIATLRCIQSLGHVLLMQGKTREAEPYLREALAGQRRLLGDLHSETLGTINDLGAALKEQGRLAEAEPFYRESMDGHRRVLGVDHRSTLTSIANYGSLLQTQGRLDDAEPYYREVLDGARRALGPEHPTTLLSINNMGYLQQMKGQLAEAEPYFREVMDHAIRLHGFDHPITLNTLHNMAGIASRRNRKREAVVYFRDALEGRRRILGDNHFNTLMTLTNLGETLYELGRYEEAEARGFEAVARGRMALPPGHWALGLHLNKHALSLRALGRQVQAEEQLLEAYETMVRVLGPLEPRTMGVAKHLVMFYEEQGQLDEAAHWRACSELEAG